MVVRRVIGGRNAGILRVLREVEDVAFIAGGAARYMIEQDAPDYGDIDVYLRTADEDGSARALLAASLAGLQYTELGRAGMSVVYGTTRRNAKPVQVIQPVRDGEHCTYGTPEEVIDGFSFTVEQYAIDLVDGDLTAIFTEDAEVAHREHRIRLHRVWNPVTSAYRLQKYGGKGYRASMDEVVKLFRAWEALTAEQRDAIAAKEWPEIAPEVMQAMGDPEIARAYGETDELDALEATTLLQGMGAPAPGVLPDVLDPALEAINMRIRERVAARAVPNWVDVPLRDDRGVYYTPWERDYTRRAWMRMAGRQVQHITDHELNTAPVHLFEDAATEEHTLNRIGMHLHGWPINPPRAPVAHDRVQLPRLHIQDVTDNTPLNVFGVNLNTGQIEPDYATQITHVEPDGNYYRVRYADGHVEGMTHDPRTGMGQPLPPTIT